MCEKHYERNLAGRPLNCPLEHGNKVVGSLLTNKGYVYIKVANGHGNREAYHRVIMELIMGRKLLPGENVHHIDRNKSNNHPTNLQLWDTSQPHGACVDDMIAYWIKRHPNRVQWCPDYKPQLTKPTCD